MSKEITLTQPIAQPAVTTLKVDSLSFNNNVPLDTPRQVNAYVAYGHYDPQGVLRILGAINVSCHQSEKDQLVSFYEAELLRIAETQVREQQAALVQAQVP